MFMNGRVCLHVIRMVIPLYGAVSMAVLTRAYEARGKSIEN